MVADVLDRRARRCVLLDRLRVEASSTMSSVRVEETTMICDAHIRPFPNDIEVVCELDVEHSVMHRGALRDYAYPGSVTIMEWADNDRRNYRGPWPGECPGCVLPLGHHGRHAE